MKNSIPLFTFFLLLTTISYAQDITKKIDSIVQEVHLKYPEVGISIGLIQNDQEFYTAYGKNHKESAIDINKNSVFEIASITKLVTANLLAQAVLEDKIKLDDYIDDYLPVVYVLQDAIKNKIKISDLASHQSGLEDLDFGKLIATNSQQPIDGVSQEDISAIINNCTELIDYGSYRYSTIGYVLLGDILEKAYGKSYDQIITEKLITPYQLTNTYTKEFDVPNLTKGYNQDGGEQEFFKWHTAAPAGLVKSSTADMVTFLKAILNNQSKAGKAAQLCETTYYNKEDRQLGLGTNILIDSHNTRYAKTGDSMGQSSILCYNRAKNWGIVILITQRNSKIRTELFNRIYEEVLK